MARKRSEVKTQASSSELPVANEQEIADFLQECEEDLARRANKKTVEFPSAQPAEEVPLGAGFQRIIEHVFIDDVWASYEKLESTLRIGDERKDYGRVMKEVDDAETNAREAHRLWMTAKVERERWELENRVVFASMRETAQQQLEREKDAKIKAKESSKMITEEDMISRVALLFPDEYRHQEVTRKKVKAMEDSMADLAAKWDSRCRSLGTVANKLR